MIDYLNKLDHQLFHFLNDTISNPILDWFMPIITNQDYWAVPIMLLWLYLIIRGGKRGRIAAVILLVFVGLTDIIAAQVIKPMVGRLRPSREMPELINLLVGRGGKYGFVSNHAANMFAAATILGYFYQRWRGLLLGLAATVAFSRVYVGVHFPGDVICGAVFGYVMAWTGLTIWVIIKMRELKQGRTWVWYESKDPEIDQVIN